MLEQLPLPMSELRRILDSCMVLLGWKWAGIVWAYALLWTLMNDRVKLFADLIFDSSKPTPLSRRSMARPSEVDALAYDLYQRVHVERQQDQDLA
jgi:hypothetical protein